MITERTGDLLKQTDLDAMIHQANCFHTMGAGVAAQLKAKWPQVYEADKRTPYGATDKLGTYSKTALHLDSGKLCMVYNLYSQWDYGSSGVHTDYLAMDKGLEAIANELEAGLPSPIKVGVPHGIGCGLAGGDWKVVRMMLEENFGKKDNFELIIVRYV